MAVQCRLCALYFCKLNPMIIFDRGLLAKIKDLTGLWLHDEEHLPRHICPSCLNELNIFTDLRQSIQQNHNRLTLKKETTCVQDLESYMSSTDSEEDLYRYLGESEESYDLGKPASLDLDDINKNKYEANESDPEPENYDDWPNLNKLDDPALLKPEDRIEASYYKQKLIAQDPDAYVQNMFSPKKSKKSKFENQNTKSSERDEESEDYGKWKPLSAQVSFQLSKNVKKALAETSVGTENVIRKANFKYPKEGEFIQIDTKMLLYKNRTTFNTKKKHHPLNLEDEYD